MSYHKHRQEFIARIAVALAPTPTHISAPIAERLMRYASTLQRLAVAQCNGDWPADNGQRLTKKCSLCGTSWVPSAITGGALARAAYEHDREHQPACMSRLHRPCNCTVRTVKACPDCRTTAAVRELVRASLPMFRAVVTGDPRGCYVVRLVPREATREDIDCGRAPIVYVPGRE